MEKIVKFEAIVYICSGQGALTMEYDGFNYIF